ncbi:alpha/beta hydrolase [Occultella gossypii]|uniref:Alpha/beta hydrolase n=1 Tax=Occultella gossypii TaxID=2800820 RepID=A0ABS7SBX9_9MICO|nr:alpha/beta hydrolase [Occultella gossypii]MBZ2197852.1 alpha/beta hydrolase [Occultella gossypii]
MAETGERQEQQRPVRRRWWRWPVRVLAALLALVLAVFLWFQVSPWPGAMLIRHSGSDGLDGAELIADYLPEDVEQHLDVVYDASSPDGRLDVLYPSGTTEPLPTVVWVHGGAFVAGTKDALVGYLSVLASHGYTVVSIEYTKAPEATYPRPVEQVNLALEYLVANAEELHVDPDQFVLAGDSAGAHIAAQSALAISDPSYAAEAGLPAVIGADQLRGTILCSGAFDPSLVDTSNPTWGFLLRTVLWAYSGTKDFENSPVFDFAALPRHVGATYPPTFLTTGPYDPLLSHTEAMAGPSRTRAATSICSCSTRPRRRRRSGTSTSSISTLPRHAPRWSTWSRCCGT